MGLRQKFLEAHCYNDHCHIPLECPLLVMPPSLTRAPSATCAFQNLTFVPPSLLCSTAGEAHRDVGGLTTERGACEAGSEPGLRVDSSRVGACLCWRVMKHAPRNPCARGVKGYSTPNRCCVQMSLGSKG